VKTASTNRAEFIQECRDGKFEGVVAAYRTFFSFEITGQMDEELVSVLPSSLQYIASCGITQYHWPPVRSSNIQ
jgi:D-3-phosphoglycerate dehydrogenase